MGQPAIAFGVGPAFCATLSDPVTFAGRLATPQQVQAAKKAYPPAKPYLAFGYGLSLNSKTETGRIVFEYPDASTAKSALPDREHRLQSGQSLSAQLPYSQMIRFVSGHTSGSSALLQVGPPAGHPLALTQMFGRLDLGFAICG
jgi:hypothetical protein